MHRPFRLNVPTPSEPMHWQAQKKCLVDDSTRKEDFVQYDEWPDLGIPQDWPFGEYAIIHAIATTRESYRISLKKPLQTYQRHRERKAREELRKALVITKILDFFYIHFV